MAARPESTLACNKCWKINPNVQMIIAHPCYHVFCNSCAQDWFQVHNSCPHCNRPIPDKQTHLKIISTNASDKAHHLFGLPPSKILEAAATAANFWDFQRRLHLHKMIDQNNNGVPRGVYEDLLKARQEDAEALRRMKLELDHYKERLHRAESEIQEKENTMALQLEHHSHRQRSPLPDRYGSTSSAYVPANMPTPRFEASPKYSSDAGGFGGGTVDTPRLDAEEYRGRPVADRNMVAFDVATARRPYSPSPSPTSSSRFMAPQTTPRALYSKTGSVPVTPIPQTLFSGSGSRSSSATRGRTYFK